MTDLTTRMALECLRPMTHEEMLGVIQRERDGWNGFSTDNFYEVGRGDATLFLRWMSPDVGGVLIDRGFLGASEMEKYEIPSPPEGSLPGMGWGDSVRYRLTEKALEARRRGILREIAPGVMLRESEQDDRPYEVPSPPGGEPEDGGLPG